MDDFIKDTNVHEEQMAKLRHRQHMDRLEKRNQLAGYILSALVAIFVVGLIVGGMFWHSNASNERDQEVKLACVSNGGTWTSLGGSPSMCIKIGAQ